MTSDTKPNGKATPAQDQPSSLDRDVALVAATLSETSLDGEGDDIGESNLATLLKQLDGANGVLNGVEDKLDGILNNLDTLLAALEGTDQHDEDKAGAEATEAHSDVAQTKETVLKNEVERKDEKQETPK